MWGAGEDEEGRGVHEGEWSLWQKGKTAVLFLSYLPLFLGRCTQVAHLGGLYAQPCGVGTGTMCETGSVPIAFSRMVSKPHGDSAGRERNPAHGPRTPSARAALVGASAALRVRAGGRHLGCQCCLGTKFEFGKVEMFWGWRVGMRAKGSETH